MSKFRQDLILRKYGIETPKTILAVGRNQLLSAAEEFDGPFLTKHNQGGKGLGIQLFQSVAGLQEYLDGGSFDEGPDGKVILQEYISPSRNVITRVELVGGRFLFAMHSSTENGFQLCPSEACQLQAAQEVEESSLCPMDGGSEQFSAASIDAEDPLVQRYLKMIQAEGIEIAGIEFVEDEDGRRYTYDINGTTNYNGSLGEKIGVNGMVEFAQYIRDTI
jgi:hypothetical protein